MPDISITVDSKFVIVTVAKPLMLHQSGDEVWMLNPNRRYIMSLARVKPIEHLLRSVSDLQGAGLLNPLTASKSVARSKILVDRCRERGVGDLLFMTGPLAYTYHLSGSTAEIDFMAYADRGSVLRHNHFLSNGTVLCGPLEYDHLKAYNYHWLVDTLSECVEEPDQLNVYDALYVTLGYDPSTIDGIWKRPFAVVSVEDYADLDRYMFSVYGKYKIDLRKNPYYVVSPFANSSLRCAPYSTWLELIKELGKIRPVVIVGSNKQRMPDMDITAGQFLEAAEAIPSVISAVGNLNLRQTLALVSKAKASVCLDSGVLYMSQAVRTPAVSLWGTHDPGVRIGYDKQYMDYAVTSFRSCVHAPCYAYSEFPAHKCPAKTAQMACAALIGITTEQIMEKVNMLEADSSLISSASK